MPADSPRGDRPPLETLPVVYPADGALLVRRKKGVPKTGKYPFRGPKRDAKRQRPHDWAKSDKWKPVFLRAYARWGTISAACDAAGVNEATVHNRRTANPEFDAEVLAARQRHNSMLEEEIIRRAVEGDDTYSYDAKNQQLVWVGKRKSDILLIFQAKKCMPEYRDNYKTDDKAEAKASVNVLVQYLKQGLDAPDGNLESLPDFDTFWKTPALPSPEGASAKPIDVAALTAEERRSLLVQLAAMEVSEAEEGPPR